MNTFYTLLIALGLCFSLPAQQDGSPLKISHAEPLYVDLIRDLGARKGEREFNAGWKLNDKAGYREQAGFFEYEFSPVNRLGLELEVPFSYYYSEKSGNKELIPNRKVQAVKPALQYTFLVSGKYRMSMAIGTIYELQLHSFKTMTHSETWIKGHHLDPFFVVAKRLGRQFHVLLYTGPDLDLTARSMTYQSNLSVHYVLPRSGDLAGLELNQEFAGRRSELVLRPQVKLRFGSRLALGLVTGIPVSTEKENLSFLMRLIYEPAKK